MTPRANVCKPPKGDKNSDNSDVLSSYGAHTVHSVSSLCSGLLMKRASRGENGLTRGTAALSGLYDREEGLVGWLVGNQISKYTRHCPRIYAGSSCDVIQSGGTETAEECATIFGPRL